MKKNSFTILELILVIILLSILYSIFKINTHVNKIDELTNRLSLQLKYLRYKALIDSKKSYSEELWFKKRWTLKFYRCREEVGGIYYVIYSDNNMQGHPNKTESLKDPLSNKYIYNSNSCQERDDLSKYSLLTKNYFIDKIQLSCNNTSSLGQISFSNDGKIYTKLSNNDSKSILVEDCKVKIIDKYENIREIEIKKETSYIKIN